MQEEYLRPGFGFCLGHATEEVGEVLIALGGFLAAAGKTKRFGTVSVNPELPVEQQESNLAWLQREMGDVRGALDRLDAAIARNLPDLI